MSAELTPDELVNVLASEQWGAVGRSQVLELGLTARQIKNRLARCRWLAPVRGVYVVAGTPPSWRQDAIVAVLAGPPGTVISHVSAASLHELADPPPVPHVTVPRSKSGRYVNVVMHHTRSPLDATEVTSVGPFPCTTPARTLVDCAELLDYDALCRLVDAALCRGSATTTSVLASAERVSRAPGRRGIAALRRALDVWDAGPRPGSPAEMRLLRLLMDWGFPRPERQIKVFDERGRFLGRVDLGWRDWKIGFEYDGEEFHTPRQAEYDARRQAGIEAVGWRLERVRKGDVRPPAKALRARVEALIAGRHAA